MSEQEELRHIKAQLDLSRRQFLQRAAVLGGGAASLPLLAACSSSSSTATPTAAPTAAASAAGPTTAPASAAATPAGSARTLEMGPLGRYYNEARALARRIAEWSDALHESGR